MHYKYYPDIPGNSLAWGTITKYLSNFESPNLKNNENDYFTLAIFVKPNVGNSTLLNNIVGYYRSNTSS